MNISKDKFDELAKQLEQKHVKRHKSLAQHTTLKIGGPADIFLQAYTTGELIDAVKKARNLNIPVTILGWGSNVLIADRGIRGLTIKNLSNSIYIKGKKKATSKGEKNLETITARWETDTTEGTFRGIEFKDLDYDESDKPKIEVVMDSGVSLPYALHYLIEKGITGLQWFAGIPGTIGGAVFNNIHGGSKFLSEFLTKVTILDKNREKTELAIKELGLDYDKSRFHNSGEIILNAHFELFLGDTQRAKYTAIEWAKRKSIQPRNSPGCAFANISQEEREKFGYPTTSVGFIIEHVLNLTGFRIGDAAISKQHHNFIVNDGRARATDYLAVMKAMYHRTKKKLGIKLVPEIFLLGFEKEEIKEFL